MLPRTLCYALLTFARGIRPSTSVRTSSSTCSTSTARPPISRSTRRRCIVHNINKCIHFPDGLNLQQRLHDCRRRDLSLPDALILLEHTPVYTLGTASREKYVLFVGEGEKKFDGKQPLLIRTDRGGEVTYHGPGQLVVYPILNLRSYRKDLHWYLRRLEDVVIRLLKEEYGLMAGRMEGLTGVWVNEKKVCAIGIKVSKWITKHGLSLNVNVDLAAFERIIPCGIHEYPVTSLEQLLGDKCPTMGNVRRAMLGMFEKVFGPWDVGFRSLDGEYR